MESTVILTVVLRFEGDVHTEEQIAEVAKNIKDGIILQADSCGVAPVDEDSFTKSVEVAHNGLILASEKLCE